MADEENDNLRQAPARDPPYNEQVALTAEAFQANCTPAAVAKLTTILRRLNNASIISLKDLLDTVNPPQIMGKVLLAMFVKATRPERNSLQLGTSQRSRDNGGSRHE